MKYGGAVVGGSLLTGCTGQSDSGSTPTETDRDETATDTSTPENKSYSVTLSPVGEVTLDTVPESFVAYYPIAADTAVALGHGDSINAIGYDKQLFGDTVDYYYDSLDGVVFEWEDLGRMTPSGNPNTLDEELFYELDSDIHFLDPCLLQSDTFGWSSEDLSRIEEDIGPWFGNYYSRTNGEPPEGCRDDYEYYSLWEYIGKFASVIQEEERYRTFKSMRDNLVSRIQSDLPSESERPSLAVIAYTGGTFWPYDFTQEGYIWNHLRPFGMTNAFAETDIDPSSDGSYDYEAMVEVEPDVVLRYWGAALGETFLNNRSELMDNPLADDVPAFRDKRYYPSGYGMQGPVMNLFQLEMTAKQLFPDQFGEWPGYENGEPYPEIPEDQQLFARQRVSDAINGNLSS
ncbi:ABC transporter substrate-binding protein [Haloarcula sp. K1]|nr:ABC transporter substrate-binding protein [Haloarcula sp. K1]